ncbi:MAG TPA: hypothetical protein VFI09_08130 [Solirubrobacterales bacterium]|nr:hypothetical protein [Solirubrobacterales bacterium]
MPDADTPLPEDPFRSGSAAVDAFTHGQRIAEAMREARAHGQAELFQVFTTLGAEDFAALAEFAIVLLVNGQSVDEERRRFRRPWRWRRRWPPWS